MNLADKHLKLHLVSTEDKASNVTISSNSAPASSDNNQKATACPISTSEKNESQSNNQETSDEKISKHHVWITFAIIIPDKLDDFCSN